MDNGHLIDFKRCFKFSLLTGRSFLCITDQTPDNNQKEQDESSSDILDNTNSSEDELTVNNENTDIIQTIEYAIKLIAKQEDMKCAVSMYDNIDPVTQKNTNKVVSDTDSVNITVPVARVFIIPDLNGLSKVEQNELVDIMSSDLYNPKFPSRFRRKQYNTIYIGLVKVPPLDSDPSIDIHKTSDLLKCCIKVQPWLKNKFWIACASPNKAEVNYKFQSTFVYENDETKRHDNVSVKDISDIASLSLKNSSSTISEFDLEKDIKVIPPLKRYIMDIMVHIRMHRLTVNHLVGGAFSNALNDLLELSRIIAFDKGVTFTTPADIKLACYWYFQSHIELIKIAQDDNSILYGSKPELVNDVLETFASLKLQQLPNYKDENYKKPKNAPDIVDYNINPLFLEYWVIRDVISKVVPPV